MRPSHLLPLLLVFACTLAQAEGPPIQQWIDDAIKAGGGVVTVPEGEHVLTQALVIHDAKKLALRGVDKERCVLKIAPDAGRDDAAPLIKITGTCQTLEIAGLTLDGGRPGHSSGGALVNITGMSGTESPSVQAVTVRDCLLQNFPGTGVRLENTTGAEVERCSFRDGGTAITFTGVANKGLARGNQIIRVQTAFDLAGASACVVEGNEIRDCATGASISNKTGPAGSIPERHVLRNNGFFNTAAPLSAAQEVPPPLLEGNEGLDNLPDGKSRP